MARRRRRSRRRTRGTGSVITTRKVSGLGKLGDGNSIIGAVIPPLIGGALAGAATILFEMQGQPVQNQQTGVTQQASDAGKSMARWAPYLGVGVGILSGAVMPFLIKGKGGKAAGAAAVTASIGVGGSFIAYRAMNEDKLVAAGLIPPTLGNVGNTTGLGRGYRMYGRRGTGAIVMEPAATAGLMGRGRTGAIVPQVQPRGMAGGLGGDPRGETVSLGNVNPSAFGTPGFAI